MENQLNSIGRAVELYNQRHHLYQQFANKVQSLIKDLLSSNNISVHIIEFRVKDVNSFREKLIRKPNQYSNPLSEVTDLVGIRVITYYQDEVQQVAEVINSEFEIDDKNSVDKGKLMQPNQFGYQYVHYVAQLAANRIALTEWKNYKELKFEVQIRSVLQHAWASISHALQYKTKQDVPSELQRKLW